MINLHSKPGGVWPTTKISGQIIEEVSSSTTLRCTSYGDFSITCMDTWNNRLYIYPFKSVDLGIDLYGYPVFGIITKVESKDGMITVSGYTLDYMLYNWYIDTEYTGSGNTIKPSEIPNEVLRDMAKYFVKSGSFIVGDTDSGSPGNGKKIYINGYRFRCGDMLNQLLQRVQMGIVVSPIMGSYNYRLSAYGPWMKSSTDVRNIFASGEESNDYSGMYDGALIYNESTKKYYSSRNFDNGEISSFIIYKKENYKTESPWSAMIQADALASQRRDPLKISLSNTEEYTDIRPTENVRVFTEYGAVYGYVSEITLVREAGREYVSSIVLGNTNPMQQSEGGDVYVEYK